MDGFERASQRTQFQLTYRRDTSREFTPSGILGEKVDHAYEPGEASTGDWGEPYWDRDLEATEEEWIARFFRAAICEAMHEALEWFQVDGRPFIDPHEQPQLFYRHVTAMADALLSGQATDDAELLGMYRMAMQLAARGVDEQEAVTMLANQQQAT